MPIILGGTGTGASPGSGASLNELIERVRLQLDDRASRDALGASMGGLITDTAITLTSGKDISEQTLIEIELELMRVMTKPTTTTGTIARAQYGTTLATHANVSEVLSGFRFSRASIRRAINYALGEIGIMFGKQVWDESVVFSPSTRLLSVPATALRVLGVSVQPTGTTNLSRVPSGQLLNVPTSLVATGRAVQLNGYNPGRGTAFIAYETAWPTLTDLSDSLDAAFPVEGEDAIELGAQAFLLMNESSERVGFDRPHTRTDAAAATESSVRVQGTTVYQRFLLRRQELAARYRYRNHAWVK